jgi:hypothetical protein
MYEPAQVLSCGIQHDIPVVWVRVDTSQPARSLAFWCVNTGTPLEELPEDATFLGTVTTSTGIVWHLFFAWKAP